MLRTREAYERILIMVNIAPLNIEPNCKGKSVLQQCKDSIEENKLRNPSQKSLPLMMVDGLLDLQDNTAIDDQGKPMQRIPFISQENLKDYLNECYSALSKKEINAFFNLYNVSTHFDRLGASNNDPIILYQRCNKMIASFTEKMIKFLTFELENTPTTRKLI